LKGLKRRYGELKGLKRRYCELKGLKRRYGELKGLKRRYGELKGLKRKQPCSVLLYRPNILMEIGCLMKTTDTAYCHCFMCVASHLMLMEALRKLRVGFLTLPTFRRGLIVSTQKTAVGTFASQISYYLLPYK
jgi:hypothetical protein